MGLQGAQARLRAFGGALRGIGGSAVGGLLAGGIGGIATALSGRAFASGIGNAIKMGGELRNLGKSTGIAVGELYELQGVFAENDKSTQDMAASMSRMQRAIGGGSKGISDLGLNFDSLQRMRPSEQFQAIGKAILAIPDPAQRAAAAMSIFGKSGASLMPVFEDVAKLDLSNLSKAAQIMQKNAEAFDEAGDSITRLKRNFQGLFLGAASEMLPAITGVAKSADQTDFVGAGERIGKKLGTGIHNVLSKDWWNDMKGAFIEMVKGNYAGADAMRANAGKRAPTAAAPSVDAGMAEVPEVGSGDPWFKFRKFKSFVEPKEGTDSPTNAMSAVQWGQRFHGEPGGSPLTSSVSSVGQMNEAYNLKFTTKEVQAAYDKKQAEGKEGEGSLKDVQTSIDGIKQFLESNVAVQ